MIFNVGVPARTRIITVTPPTVTVGTYTYNGTAQGPTISAYDSNVITVTNGTAINAGVYTMTVSLKNKATYRWTDNTTEDKTYEYAISKVTPALTLSANSVTLVSGNAASYPITITTNSDGTIFPTSANEDIVEVKFDYNENKVRFDPSRSISGSTTATIRVDESTNYNAVEATVSVTVSLTTVTWASGTVQQIAAMLRAHYGGVIDIHNYWSVGDERTISLVAVDAYPSSDSEYGCIPAMPAQNLTFVLMHSGGKLLADYYTDSTRSTHRECAFVVGAKSCLNTTSPIGNTNSDRWSWGYANMYMSTWLCPGVGSSTADTRCFWAMFPDGYFFPNNRNINDSEIFKRTYWYSEQKVKGTYRPSNMGTFGLASEVEVFGEHDYSEPNDSDDDYAAQFSYYSLGTSHRTKKLGASGYSNTRWWLRSIDYYGSIDNYSHFENVTNSGGLGYPYSPGSNYFGVCPHAVI